MITKTKVIRDINYIRDETPVTFKNFGGFFLKLMMLPVKDQEFIVDGLVKATKRKPIVANIVIHSVDRTKINLKENQQHLRFILEHEFKCKLCGQIWREQINMSSNAFKDICDICMDEIRESDMEENHLWRDNYYD